MSITSRLNTLAAAGSGSSIGWILELEDPSQANNVNFYGGDGSASQNVIYGIGKGLTSPESLIASVDLDGNVNWTKAINDAGVDSLDGGALDGPDLIVAGQYVSGGQNAFIAKITDQGNVTWSNYVNQQNTRFQRINVVSGYGIYASGWSTWNSQGSYDFFLAKYDFSGNIQNTSVTGGSSLDFTQDAAWDPVNQVMVLFGQYYINGNYLGALARYDANVNLYDKVALTPQGGNTEQWVGTVDNGSAIFAGRVYDGGRWKANFGRFNSSLQIQSPDEQIYEIQGSSNYVTSYSPQIMSITPADSNQDFYAAIKTTNLHNQTDVVVAKIDILGNIIWSNSIYHTSLNQLLEIRKIKLLDDDTLALIGFTKTVGSGAYKGVIAKIPTDGSLGSGGNWTMQAEVMNKQQHRGSTQTPGINGSTYFPNMNSNPVSTTTTKTLSLTLTDV